jgi:hypothetical protein
MWDGKPKKKTKYCIDGINKNLIHEVDREARKNIWEVGRKNMD